jgi:hypothetical protein
MTAPAVTTQPDATDPLAVEVDVCDGGVTLIGAVYEARTAETAVRLIEAVPGVAAVADRLAVAADDLGEAAPSPGWGTGQRARRG